MFKRQRGVTFIGWLLLLVPLVIVGYSAIRLVPIYLNYMRVVRSIDETASEMRVDQSNAASEQLVRSSLARHFDIESITFPDLRDIIITRDGQNWTIEAKYQDGAPLFGNLSLMVDFDKVAKTG